MAESDFFKNTATGHHETTRGTTVPDTHSNDAETHHPETMHDDAQHGGHEEETSRTEREVVMNTKTAPTFTALALALFVAFGSTLDGNAKPTGPAFTDITVTGTTVAEETAASSDTTDFRTPASLDFDFETDNFGTPTSGTSLTAGGAATATETSPFDFATCTATTRYTRTEGAGTGTGTTGVATAETPTGEAFTTDTGDDSTVTSTGGATFKGPTTSDNTFATTQDCFGGCDF